MNDIAGASRNSHRLASAGKVSSFRMFLTPSAAGCSRPAQPTRLGPRRFCIQALTFRSMQREQRHADHDDREHQQHLEDAEENEALQLRRHRAAPGAGAGAGTPAEHPAGEAEVRVGQTREDRPAARPAARNASDGRRRRVGARARPGEHLARHPPGRPRHAGLRLGLVKALEPAVAIDVGAVLFGHRGDRQHQLRVAERLGERRCRARSRPAGADASAASSAALSSASSTSTTAGRQRLPDAPPPSRRV